jgi:hypothetical protein
MMACRAPACCGACAVGEALQLHHCAQCELQPAQVLAVAVTIYGAQ